MKLKILLSFALSFATIYSSTANSSVWGKIVATAADLVGAARIKQFDELLVAASNQTTTPQIVKSLEDFRLKVNNPQVISNLKLTPAQIDQTAYGISFAKGFANVMEDQWKNAANPAAFAQIARRSRLRLSDMKAYEQGLNGALENFNAEEVTRVLYLRTLQSADTKLDPAAFTEFKTNLAKYMDPEDTLKLSKISDAELNSALGKTLDADTTRKLFDDFFQSAADCD